MSKTSQPPLDGDQTLYECLHAWMRENPTRQVEIIAATATRRSEQPESLTIHLSTPQWQDSAVSLQVLKAREPKEDKWHVRYFDPTASILDTPT